VEVLEDQEEGLLARFSQQQPLDPVEGELAALARVERAPRGIVDRHVEQRQQRRQRRLQPAVEGEQLARHLLPDVAEVVPGLDLEVALEEIDHRQVTRRLAVRDRSSLEDPPALQAMRVEKLVDEPRLAHPRLADDRPDLTVAIDRELLGAAELLQLGIATDEAGQPAPGGRLQAGPRLASPRHFVDLHRLGQTLNQHRAQRFHLDVAFSQRQRLGRDHDPARIRELLHPRGQVRGLANRRVVHAQIAANGPHDDLPGVQPDADLHHRGVRASHLLRVLLHALLHPERRVAGPYRVILVREGRTEERHDTVAHDLVDRALVAVHGLHHPFEHGVEKLACLLRVPVGQQLHRALEVGEEHGDLLAFALERALRRQNLLGEVLRGVRFGRSGARSSRTFTGCPPALQTELRVGRQIGPASAAAKRQPGAALQAEFGAGGVVAPAPAAMRHGHQWRGL
jgi:hypothetical protein